MLKWASEILAWINERGGKETRHIGKKTLYKVGKCPLTTRGLANRHGVEGPWNEKTCW